MENKTSYLQKRISAFSVAFKGIGYFFKREAHAKIHALAAVCVVCAGLFFGISNNQWLAIIICIAMVFAAEAFNSAIELLTDSIYKERHSIAGQIKDIAAGAVLICAIGSVGIAAIIFIPYIVGLFQ